MLRKQNENNVISNSVNKKTQNADECETAKYATSPSTPLPTKKLKLTNVGVVLNAYGLSHRHGATICNAMLKDLNMTDEANIIDPTRMRRVKEKVAKEATVAHMKYINSLIESASFFGMYFDGRNDNTFTVIANSATNQNHPRIERQNHYDIVIQRGDNFYTHLTPNGSRALNAAECIYNKLMENELDCSKLQFIGCDGTAQYWQ